MPRSSYSNEDKIQILQNQKASGKTVSDYCKHIGISAPTFYLWKKKLHEHAPVSAERSGKPDTTAPRLLQKTHNKLSLPPELELGFCRELMQFLNENERATRRFQVVLREEECVLELR